MVQGIMITEEDNLDADKNRSFSWPAVATLIIGIIALATSTLIDSVVLAFIGLGLAFWGSILLYVQNQDYVPARALCLSSDL